MKYFPLYNLIKRNSSLVINTTLDPTIFNLTIYVYELPRFAPQVVTYFQRLASKTKLINSIQIFTLSLHLLFSTRIPYQK